MRTREKTESGEGLAVWRKLREERQRHEHPVTMLATFEQNRTYNIVYQFAASDLFGYWREFPNPLTDNADMTERLLQQREGLAAGLQTIHRAGLWEAQGYGTS